MIISTFEPLDNALLWKVLLAYFQPPWILVMYEQFGKYYVIIVSPTLQWMLNESQVKVISVTIFELVVIDSRDLNCQNTEILIFVSMMNFKDKHITELFMLNI